MQKLTLILAVAVFSIALLQFFTETGCKTENTAELDVQRHQQECVRLAEATGADINLISFGGRDCGERSTASTFSWTEN
jgi:hypothetical protein